MTDVRQPAADSDAPVVDALASADANANHSAERRSAATDANQPRSFFRQQRLWLAVGLLIVVSAVLVFFWPRLVRFFQTVSTDDAYVSGHVTYVSARVDDVVEEVLVDENDFVEAGTLLLKLDRRPYQVIVDQKQAALAQAKLKIDQLVAAWKTAQTTLAKVKNDVTVDLASLREGVPQIELAQDAVRATIATLHSNVETRKLNQANELFAQKDYDRYLKLGPTGTVSKEDIEQRRDNLQVAQESVLVAEQSIQQTRAKLGLAPNTEQPLSLPADLAQTHSSVRSAVASVQQTLARLGVELPPQAMRPSEVEALVEKLTANFNIDQVPDVKVAQAQVDSALAALGGAAFDPARPYDHPSVAQAAQDLAQAELDLSYTEVTSAVTGFVSKRSVNPGDHVQPGQSLLAIHPLDDVWVNANFKETQIHDLRIGQPVDIYVDAYPGRIFQGRVAGFRAATGASLSLLPPENATGNFVKVVQRIPVRIELVEPNPRDAPLLVGLSAVPYVRFREPPSGPDAGERLRLSATQTPAVP